MGGDSREPSIRVFISSTYLDNAERRKVVEDAVLRAGMQPVGMERFTASDHPTVEECERWACECDVYVGIVAHCYGWFPDGRQTSITEIEYDAAKAAGRPRFMFEIDRKAPVYPDNDYDEGADRWDKQKKLEAFRKKYAADQLPGYFSETTLSGMVVQCLKDWRERGRPRVSTPTPPQMPDAAPMASDEIVRYCRARDGRSARARSAMVHGSCVPRAAAATVPMIAATTSGFGVPRTRSPFLLHSFTP